MNNPDFGQLIEGKDGPRHGPNKAHQLACCALVLLHCSSSSPALFGLVAYICAKSPKAKLVIGAISKKPRRRAGVSSAKNRPALQY
jgi:hypothetical protein